MKNRGEGTRYRSRTASLFLADMLSIFLHILPVLSFYLKDAAVSILLPLFFISLFLYVYGRKASVKVLTSFYFVLGSIALMIWIFAYASLESSNKTRLILQNENITELTGTLIRDSSLTSSHGGIYQVRINEIYDENTGIRAEAFGRATIITRESSGMTEEGARVRFRISDFKEDLIFASSAKVVSEPSLLVSLRKGILNDSQRRIMALSPNSLDKDAWNARKLSLMLLLSRFEGEEFPLKDKAKDVGIAHVFALSGMHLNLIASFVIILIASFCPTSKRRKAAVPVLFLYTLIIGASPSLVRAFLMFTITTFFKELRKGALFISLILQTIILKESVTSVAFVFSYVSTASLIAFSTLMNWALSSVFERRVAAFLSPSVAALFATVPFSIFMFGFWSPYGIILSPIMTVLAALSMFGGLVAIILPGSNIAGLIMDNSYRVIESIVNVFAETSIVGSWQAYAVFIMLVLFFIFLKYFRLRRVFKV